MFSPVLPLFSIAGALNGESTDESDFGSDVDGEEPDEEVIVINKPMATALLDPNAFAARSFGEVLSVCLSVCTFV